MNEPAEFERLLIERLDSLYSYALALTRRADEAHDLLQDGLARGFERFQMFDRSLSFKAWMFTIMRHSYIDGLRRRRARGRETEAAWLLDGGEPDASVESPLYSIPLDPEAILARRESAERAHSDRAGSPEPAPPGRRRPVQHPLGAAGPGVAPLAGGPG